MTLTDAELGSRARTLALTIEPFTGQVYFSPECHANYVALGFSPSPGTFGNDVHLPDGPAYFSSRGGVMGQVPGELVAAAFGVFNPDTVIPAVAFGWTLTDAATISAARTDGAIAQLVRLLGDEPDGLDRVVELLHRATEPLRPEGRPLFAGIRSRGWADHHFDTAESCLNARGLFRDRELTAAGRAAREQVEIATDRQMRSVIEALGDDFDELVGTIGGWSRTIQAGSGYPQTGPHQLAKVASRAHRRHG